MKQNQRGGNNGTIFRNINFIDNGYPVWLPLGITRVERMQKDNQQDAEAKQKIYQRGGGS